MSAMHLTLAHGAPALIASSDVPYARGTAVVDFRTFPNGAYRWMSGMRRGYWRVLELRDANGSRNIDSHNVISVLYAGHPGIDGVTARSKYHIGASLCACQRIAADYNLAGVLP